MSVPVFKCNHCGARGLPYLGRCCIAQLEVEIPALRLKVEEQAGENERLRKENAKWEALNGLRLLNAGPSPRGGFALNFEDPTRMTRLLAQHFFELLHDHDAPNYLEMLLKAPDGRGLIVTLQREEGKTPHLARQEAEAERDRLAALIEQAPHGPDCYPTQPCRCWKSHTRKET